MQRLAWAGGLCALLIAGCSSAEGPAATSPAAPTSTVSSPSASVAPTGEAGTTVVARAAVGGNPCGVAVTPGAVWVSDAERDLLHRLDPLSGRVVATSSLDRSPCEIAVGFGSLWVVTQSGILDRVDPASGEVVARVSVGQASYEAVETGGFIWVSNRGSGTLSKVDPRRNATVATVRLPLAHPGGLVAVGPTLWIGNDASGEDQVVVYDTRSAATRRVAVGRRPAYVTTAGGLVYVSLQEDSAVARVDPRTARLIGTTPAGASPVNLDGRAGTPAEVWVPDDAGGVVTRIDAASGQVVESIEIGGGPAAVAAPAGGDVWVTRFEAGEVWALRPGPR